jgi:hypothetical protein
MRIVRTQRRLHMKCRAYCIETQRSRAGRLPTGSNNTVSYQETSYMPTLRLEKTMTDTKEGRVNVRGKWVTM